MRTTFLVTILGLFLTACAHETVDPTRAVASARRVEYVPETSDDIVYLSMEPVIDGKKSYEMELSAVNPTTTNMCDFSAAFQMENELTFSAKRDACEIKVTFDSKKYLRATIEQTGQDFECDCGRNVSLNGRIKVKR